MASPELEAGEAVIPLVLRRSQLALGTLCKLLCSSSATAAAVHNSCAGTIELQLTSKEVDTPEFFKWLSKHAVLLRSIEEEIFFRDEYAAAAKEIAAALSRAAALPDGLKLISLQTCSLSMVKATAGSCSSLTCLELVLSKEALFPTAKEATACIAGLSSQLSSLTLHSSFTSFDSTDGSAMCHNGQRTTTPGCGLHSLLAECLPQLTVLTRLAIDEVADTAILKHAPPQLLELEAMGVDDQCTSALELGHLSSCTSLVLPRNPEYELEGWRDVKAHDTLPPNLQWLSMTDCHSATPLLGLTKLTGLVIAGHCHMPVAELQRLSSLTQLEHVHLGYNVYRGGFADDAAEKGSPGWGFVPALKELELRRMIVVDAVQHLAACTNLTRLVWEETYVPGRVYRDGGLGALRQSLPTTLRELEFQDFIPAPRASPGPLYNVDEASIVPGLYCLREAIDALPDLQSCSMVDWENGSCFSRAGAELTDAIMDGMYDFDEFIEAFIEAYPGFLDSDESEGSSGGAEEDTGAGSEGCSGGAEGDAEAGSEGDGNAASAQLVVRVQGVQL